MIAWADRQRMPAVAADAPTSSIADLVRSIDTATGEIPASIAVPASADEPALAMVGQRRLLVDPRTGQLLGDSAPRLRAFFRTVTDWHRWLALAGEQRALGKAVTGWANLIFAFIVLSGMYLWLPRIWRWRQVRAIVWFRGGLRGKARDFNWHNAIGIWSAVPLFLVVISALPISFPWASNLVYRLAGEAPPAAGVRTPPGAERARGEGLGPTRRSRRGLGARRHAGGRMEVDHPSRPHIRPRAVRFHHRSRLRRAAAAARHTYRGARRGPARQMGNLRRAESWPARAQHLALPAHRRGAGSAGTNHCRPGLPRWRRAGVDRAGVDVAPLPRLARASRRARFNRGLTATRSA